MVIPFRLPGLNDYVEVCRSNRYGAAKFKRDIENDIIPFLNGLPVFSSTITIDFYWIEPNKRRDYDNIAFAKKFVLDALQKSGKLKNDSWRYIAGFSDHFEVEKEAKVILIIKGG